MTNAIEPGEYLRIGSIIGRNADGSALRDEPETVTVITGKVRQLIYDFEPEPCVRCTGPETPNCWVAVRVLKIKRTN